MRSADAGDDGAAVYTDAVIEHATQPRNVGVLERPDGVGVDGNPVYGNLVRISVSVRNGHIAAARFKAFGCSATIAAASMTTVLAAGARWPVARALDGPAIEQALGGLPPEKRYCAAVAVSALHRALDACGEPAAE